MVEYVCAAHRSFPGPPRTASHKPYSFSSHPLNQAGVQESCKRGARDHSRGCHVLEPESLPGTQLCISLDV